MINVSTKAMNALLSDVRYIKHKVLIKFDSGYVDITDDVISVDTLEESSNAMSEVPFGAVSYNELTINLDNMDKKYTISNEDSPYYKMLKSGLEVIIKYYVEIDEDVFEEIPGGTFYTTDDWKSNTNSTTASIVCFDKLFTIGLKEPNRIRAQKNVPVRNAIKLVLEGAGLKPEEYIINSNLVGTITLFWIDELTVLDALRNIAISACCNIYVNKNNIIVATPIINKDQPVISLKDTDVLIDINSEPSYKNKYDSVTIDYNEYEKITSEVVLDIEDIDVPSGVTWINNLQFNKCPIINLNSIIIISNKNAYVADYKFNSSSISIKVDNPGTKCKASIKATGQCVNSKQVAQKVGAQESSNTLKLTLPYSYSDNSIVAYGNKIVDMYSSYVTNIMANIRGVPILEIGDKIEIDSSVAATKQQFIIQRLDTTFESGYSSSLTLSVAGLNMNNKVVFVGPGMYTKVRR